ncbi:MAG: putative CRISPR-associated protein [Aigarchaeota archaeon]|nr:putative CRISPR-associated protein [Candidatus Calditenuaceae archaeon]
MGRRYVHLVTVGASLLNNAVAQDQQVRNLVGGQKRIDEVERLLVEGKVNREDLVKALRSYVDKAGYRASAELNSISDYLAKRKVDLVYLLHTDTKVGSICGETLELYFWDKGIDAKGETIEGFMSEREFAERGLQNLLIRAHELIKRHKDDIILLNATGGFKPEGAALSIIAFILGKPIYYRHETFGSTINIPPLPIDWNQDMLTHKYRQALMELINRGSIDKKTFEERFSKEIAEKLLEEYLVIRETGDRYELTPLGRLIYRVAFADP